MPWFRPHEPITLVAPVHLAEGLASTTMYPTSSLSHRLCQPAGACTGPGTQLLLHCACLVPDSSSARLADVAVVTGHALGQSFLAVESLSSLNEAKPSFLSELFHTHRAVPSARRREGSQVLLDEATGTLPKVDRGECSDESHRARPRNGASRRLSVPVPA